MLSYLKPMTEADLDSIVEIEKRAYDYPWSQQGFENSLDQGLNYIFCNEAGQLLGYCCVLPVLDEAHLLNICVSRDFQGKGVAQQAIKKLFDVLLKSNFSVVFLEVRASNHPARQLYRKLGFTEDGVRSNYYRSKAWCEKQNQLVDAKEDAILMSYHLEKDSA